MEGGAETGHHFRDRGREDDHDYCWQGQAAGKSAARTRRGDEHPCFLFTEILACTPDRAPLAWRSGDALGGTAVHRQATARFRAPAGLEDWIHARRALRSGDPERRRVQARAGGP